MKRWRTLPGGEGFGLILVLFLLCGTVWGFVEIADEVMEGEYQRVEESLVRSLRRPDDATRPIGPAWMAEVGRDLTALGGVACLALVTLFAAGYLALAGKRHTAVLVLAATLSGLGLSTALKEAFDRERPEVVPHLSYVSTSSFPSGHSMLSSVVYLTLGTLLARAATRRRLKVYCIQGALVLTVLVGLSRVYLGVHYPTDVLGGWAAGLAWALVCWLVARWLQRRGTVEAAEESRP